MRTSDEHRQLSQKLLSSCKASQAVDDSVLDAVLKASDLSKPVHIGALQRAKWTSNKVSKRLLVLFDFRIISVILFTANIKFKFRSASPPTCCCSGHGCARRHVQTGQNG